MNGILLNTGVNNEWLGACVGTEVGLSPGSVRLSLPFYYLL